MITKSEARGAKVDWEAVERATEIARTYLVVNKEGREFFKMYKPSEANSIFKAKGWKGKIISTLNKNPRNKT